MEIFHFPWTLLKKGEQELVKRVFLAMKEFRVKSDWMSQIEDDLLSCDIQLKEEEIAAMSRWKFKKIVDGKIREQSEQYLAELQIKHSKSTFLHQGEKMQEYLCSDKLSTREKQLLFKLRSSVTPNKSNFRKKYEMTSAASCAKILSNLKELFNLSANFQKIWF